MVEPGISNFEMHLKSCHFFAIGATFVIASMLFPFPHQTTKTGKNYEEKVDRFADEREVSYEGECTFGFALAKSKKGELCFLSTLPNQAIHL